MIRLVIFDLDGTLLNTLQDLAECTNVVLRRHGFLEHHEDAYRYFVGNGIPTLIERALPDSFRTPEIIAQVLEDFMPYYNLHKADKTAPYTGIVELLETLQQRNIAIAVASNKTHSAMAPLLAHYFPTIKFAAFFGNRPQIPIKPHPQVVEDVLAQTGISKLETLYVGDTAVDMETAANAGLRKIGVLWGFREREELVSAGADILIEKPDEILNYL